MSVSSPPPPLVVILLRMAAPHSCTTAGTGTTGTTGEMKPGEGPKQTPPGRLADLRGQHPVEKYASPIPKARAIRYAGIGRGSQPLEIFNAPRIRETKLRDMKCRVNSRPGGRSKAGTPLQIGPPPPLVFLLVLLLPLHLVVYLLRPCDVPDLNHELVSSVWRAGPQPRSCEFSVACRTSTTIL